MLQIYKFFRNIDSQFNTIDSQNAFCESIFFEKWGIYALLSHSLGVMPVMALKVRKKEPSLAKPDSR